MKEIEVLKSKFSANVPISIQDIRDAFSNLSTPRVAQIVDMLEESGELIRFSMGIYYIPTKTIFGVSKLNPQDVVVKKYVEDNGNVFGFYTGLTFLNTIGVTNQVPNTLEIFTNNEKTRGRIVKVGGQNVLVKKSRLEVTKDNYKELQMLECLNALSTNELEKIKDDIVEFAKNSNINVASMLKLSKEFPAKATKNLISSGVIYGIV